MHESRDVVLLRLWLLRSVMEAALNQLSHACVFLDGQGRFVMANRAATSLLDKKDGLRLSRGELHGTLSSESSQLRELIAQAVRSGKTAAASFSGAMLISRRQAQPLRVLVSRYLSNDGRALPVVAASVEVYDPQSDAATPCLEMLRTLYGLTGAEARLSVQLAEGRDLSEAASMNRVTRETVRSQLRSIFQKTGTRRQAELMRLLVSLPQNRNGNSHGFAGESTRTCSGLERKPVRAAEWTEQQLLQSDAVRGGSSAVPDPGARTR